MCYIDTPVLTTSLIAVVSTIARRYFPIKQDTYSEIPSTYVFASTGLTFTLVATDYFSDYQSSSCDYYALISP